MNLAPHETSPDPDEQRLKELLARIPTEHCSAPRCSQPAAAVVQREGRNILLCVVHAQKAARRGLPVFQPTEGGGGVEQFVADRELIQSRWEAKWSAAAFAPEWRMRRIPREIQDAVEEGWFPPGGTILDIGCGSGEIAAWLARRGYSLLGVDFAEAAIERAKEAYAGLPGLTFEVGDIRHRAPRVGEFDALLDRGCLQGIGEQYAPAYVGNVAASAKHGARFLLLYPSDPNRGRDEWVRHLQELLGPAFEIVRIADTVFERHSGDSEDAFREGLALWMIRR